MHKFLYLLLLVVPNPLRHKPRRWTSCRRCSRFFKSIAMHATGRTKQKSGLRLDIKSEAFQGGDGWGPSLVAGQSQRESADRARHQRRRRSADAARGQATLRGGDPNVDHVDRPGRRLARWR